ncbi:MULTISPECIES: ester cyclase [Dietzia]|uniref:ester cyclase n=1 Tax=Dietzia TaxID=37914 RepID=UPI000E7D7C2F|nr:nuclear transport factor 2 family protein [Dietzia cinnamea]MCT2299830.1 nuclear transport factor 2 family protein [Dietzia cinnamea]HBD21873.1 hypothetical protein [Dietzia sp.]
MATTRSVIEQHIRAFNDQDTESEPWSQGAELMTPGGEFTGREGILGFFGVFQGAFSNGTLTVNSWIVEGDRAPVEGRVLRDPQRRAARAPGGEVPPSGKPVTFQWSASYQVRGDELASEHLYFDQLGFLGQLDLLPE